MPTTSYTLMLLQADPAVLLKQGPNLKCKQSGHFAPPVSRRRAASMTRRRLLMSIGMNRRGWQLPWALSEHPSNLLQLIDQQVEAETPSTCPLPFLLAQLEGRTVQWLLGQHPP